MLNGDMLRGRADELLEHMLESFDEGYYPDDEMCITNVLDLTFAAKKIFGGSIYEKDITLIVNEAMLVWQLRYVHNDDFDESDAVKEVLGYLEDSWDFEEDALLQHCRNYLDWHEFTRLYEDTLYNIVVTKLVESCQDMAKG